MYSQAAISALVNRIGFGSSTEVDLSEANKTGTSGRLFSYFHKLVTPTNLFYTVNKIDMESDEFNSYLTQLKKDAVMAVLTDILDKNKSYRSDFDYSDTIFQKPALFEDAIGYSVAISAIEQMISTSRESIEKRNAALAYQKLKIELEGARDREGNIIATGLAAKYDTSTKKAARIIFPNPIAIESAKFW